MLELVAAIVVQVVVFGIFFYLDAWATVEPNWVRVRSLALHPLVILFFGLMTVVLWATYRITYRHFESFWAANLFTGLLLAIVHIAMAYLGSRQLPNVNQAIALGLTLFAVIISNVGNWGKIAK